MRVAAWVFAGLALLPRQAQAGPLDDIRDAVHGDDGGSDDSSDDDNDDDDGFCLLCGLGSSGGGSTLDLDKLRLNLRHYRRYPYADGGVGYVVDAAEDPAAKRWSIAARAEGAWVAQGLWRVGMEARAAYAWAELDTEWGWLRDPTNADSLWLGNFNFSLSPIRGRRFIFRTGIGARVMIDPKPKVPGESGHAAGINGSVGLDLFLMSPLVLQFRGDVGKLGGALTWRSRGTLGVMLGPLQIFAGGDITRIGPVALDAVVFGVGGWL